MSPRSHFTKIQQRLLTSARHVLLYDQKLSPGREAISLI